MLNTHSYSCKISFLSNDVNLSYRAFGDAVQITPQEFPGTGWRNNRQWPTGHRSKADEHAHWCDI